MNKKELEQFVQEQIQEALNATKLVPERYEIVAFKIVLEFLLKGKSKDSWLP